MKLQELIEQTELEMNLKQVKAFLLGTLTADKPLPFAKALEELLFEAPESKEALEADLKKLWDDLKANRTKELTQLFPADGNHIEFLQVAQVQLDYFLTAMTLAGTNPDNCEDEDLAEILDELEDTVTDLDDYFSQAKPSKEDGEELKKFLQDTWAEFIKAKK